MQNILRLYLLLCNLPIQILGKRNLKVDDLGNSVAGIYASISLPSLNVGTVGGGTSLATQKECLQLIDCYGNVSFISMNI